MERYYAALLRFGAKQHVEFAFANVTQKHFGCVFAEGFAPFWYGAAPQSGFQNKKQTTRVCFLFWSGLRSSLRKHLISVFRASVKACLSTSPQTAQ